MTDAFSMVFFWVNGCTAVVVLLVLLSKPLRRCITSFFNKQSLMEAALLAILHDRLHQACTYFIKQGHITLGELDNLGVVYKTYAAMGGNGTCKELFERVMDLPLCSEDIGTMECEGD